MKKIIQITCKYTNSLPIDRLKAFQGKLKTIDEEAFTKLKESILRYGFSFPIFIWNKNILDGHQRFYAVQRLIDEGYELKDNALPVVWIEAKNAKEAAEKLLLINSRYAKIDQQGFDGFIEEFDIDIGDLGTLIDIPEVDFDFDFDQKDEAQNEYDDIPDLPAIPETQEKDVWILAGHRLMCGDSTDQNDIKKLMNGDTADLCFTSPPYNLKKKIISPRSKNKSKKVYNDYRDKQRSFIDLLKLYDQYAGAFAVNIQPLANNRLNLIDFLHYLDNRLIDIMVWYKHTTAPNFHKSILSKGYEFIIIYFSR